MHPRRILLVCLSLTVALLTLASPAFAQEANARISGVITDSSKALVPNAAVAAVNKDTNVRFPTKTNGSGVYVLPDLPIGEYRIEVEHIGFKSIVESSITLHTQDALELNFEMAPGSASETVTVNGNSTNDSPAVSMTVSHEFIEDVPLNGQSLQDLVQLAPGTVSTTTGYYIIDGQRDDSNNYTVDGMSANLGGVYNIANGAGSGISGSTASQTELGTTQSLASIDTLEEFKLQTSGYTAEFGRNPGGQVQFTTRSGTNDIHGTAFDYFRNTFFDANTFSNDFNHDKQTAEHQNDFGGTVGGPIVIPKLYDGRNKSFFFFSYEGLRLLLPTSETEDVPTAALRSYAAPGVQPFLNFEPLPNPTSPVNNDGCTFVSPTTGQTTTCDALFYEGYSYPNTLDNTSIRIDHNFGDRFHVFARYADTPSSKVKGLETLIAQTYNSHSLTAGLTASISKNVVEDLRFNFSDDGEFYYTSEQSVNGSTPMPSTTLIPSAYAQPFDSGIGFVEVPGTDLFAEPEFGGMGSILHQFQVVEGLSWNHGKHVFKFGSDWRRIASQVDFNSYQNETEILSLNAIQQGLASDVIISAEKVGKPVFDNLSLYAQDHFKITSRLSVDYGLRWEFNPPPGPSNGAYPATLTSSDVTLATLAPLGTQPYKTYYDHFAPRLGFAWNAIPSRRYALTVRGGFGIFFDTGQQNIGDAYDQNYPFKASNPTLTNVPLPAPAADLQPPSLDFALTPPYPQLEVQSPGLTMPYTEEWNLSLDEALNSKNTFTVSYVGNNGKKLLFDDYYPTVPGNTNLTSLTLETNAANSNYNALQVQDVGRIAAGLELVASFTFAHSLDNASNDASDYYPIYGNSNYDLRRAINLALNYKIPSKLSNLWVHAVTSGWTLDNRFSAQSGYPITNLYQAQTLLPNGNYEYYYPNLVPHVPIYLHGKAGYINGNPAPYGWRLNPAAFSCTPTSGATPCVGTPTENGNLGRNYVRNPSFWALNTSVQRSFPVYKELHLLFRADAFNIFNHPNPDAPYTTLSNSDFGELYGPTTNIGTSNALYAMGAARSLQFSLKLQF